jgi:hypothetical protein
MLETSKIKENCTPVCSSLVWHGRCQKQDVIIRAIAQGSGKAALTFGISERSRIY